MIGKTISHYKITEKLGSGGMGIVYKAQDLKLDRFVALKFLPTHITTSDEEKQRFIHEAKAASSLDHNNICAIHEIDETEDGQLFISMAYYEGETLQLKIEKGLLKIEEVIDYAIQIAQGLQRAHEKEIVHRDIKPANIILTEEGVVKVLDFGLAKLSTQTKLTKESTTLGTVSYMSPEQAKGEEVDHRTDIWSLGVVLFELVAGQLPFKGDYDQAVVYSILNEESQFVAELNADAPPGLCKVIRKCLEKEPSKRYQQIDDLINDLNLLHEGSDVSVEKHYDQKKKKTNRKKIILSILGGVVGLIIVIIIIRYVFLHGDIASLKEDRTMLVILPFENVGPAENVYFTDGITDEITGRLGTVNSIGVISRNSANHYSGAKWETEQVGKELNVEYIVAGTVRWAYSGGINDRVRITPRLIRVEDDTEIWAESYDRVVNDIFTVQAEIASEVVKKLGISLRQSERQTFDEESTNNLEAYQAFLQGLHCARSPHFTFENWMNVIESYQRAVELDSNYAIAHANLASSHARLRFLRHDLSVTRLALAEKAARKAKELAPNSAQVFLALGYYHLWAHRDLDRALENWTMAEKIIPNDPRIWMAKANVFETQGRFDDAQQAIERAFKYNPRDASLPTNLAYYFWFKRQYSRAIDMCNQAIMLAPDENWPYLYKAYITWSWKGATSDSRHAIEAAHSDYHWIPWAWFWQDVGERKYKEGLDRLESFPGIWIRNKMWALPKTLMQAMIYDFLGKPDSALEKYKVARKALESEVKKWTDDPRYHSSLGIVYAKLGRPEEALKEGKKAVELLPISKDAAYGIPYAEDLARIYILIGDEEAALDQIEMLLNIPSWISVNYLKMIPLYDRVADNPRFQEILAKHKELYEKNLTKYGDIDI